MDIVALQGDRICHCGFYFIKLPCNKKSTRKQTDPKQTGNRQESVVLQYKYLLSAYDSAIFKSNRIQKGVNSMALTTLTARVDQKDKADFDKFCSNVGLIITVRRSRQSGVARATCPD